MTASLTIVGLDVHPVEFFVEGHPQTAGSKAAITNPKTGKAIVVESGDRSAKRTWREDVRAGAREALPDDWRMEGPFEVRFTFVRRRPKGHYGSGRNAWQLKPNAPAYPTSRPDALKLHGR